MEMNNKNVLKGNENLNNSFYNINDMARLDSYYYIVHINNLKEMLEKGIFSHNKILELGIIQKKEFEEIEPLTCEIVGHRIFENKEWITIAQEKWDGEMGAKYVHVIPKVSILKITKLKEVGR
jgi:hypothetical protein